MRDLATSITMVVLTATCVSGLKQVNRPAQAHFEHIEVSEGRNLSPEQYDKIRMSALAMARGKVISKLNNPSQSQNGVDRRIVAAIHQQRAYLLQRSSFVEPISAASNCQTPHIRSVNGKMENAVFTPQLPDNVYRIEGCMFGSVPGQIQLEPHPDSREQPALPIRMRLKPVSNSWSDTEIDAYLDDTLSGVLDAPVTLVIFPGKGQRVEFPGCFFVARRGAPKLLNVVPASWVKLQATAAAGRGIKQLEYLSPAQAKESIPSGASDTSALILRSDSVPFEAGTDILDLSRLNTGWRAETVQLQHYVVSCPGDVLQTHRSGRWATTWADDGVKVNWAAETCSSYIPPQSRFELSTALYAVTIWVVGPAGTEPIGTK